MTATGTAARLIAKYGPVKAEDAALAHAHRASVAFNDNRTRPIAYYVMRWEFWESVARCVRAA